jgi:hypothetical protein
MKKTTLLATLFILISYLGNAQTETVFWESDLSTQTDIDSWTIEPALGWLTDNGNPIFSVNTLWFNDPSLNSILKSPNFVIDSGATAIDLEFEGLNLTFGFAPNTITVYIYDTTTNPTGDFSGTKEQIGSNELPVFNGTSITTASDVLFTVPDSYSGKTVGLIFTSTGTSLPQITGIANFKVSTQNTLSIPKNTLKELRFFPNPVTDIMTLQTQEDLYSVVLYDQLGKRLQTFNQSQLVSKKLDLSHLPSGIYILDITDINKKTGFVKLAIK